MKEALSSSETSVLTRATRRNIPEDNILHSHRREKSQILPMIDANQIKIHTGKLSSNKKTESRIHMLKSAMLNQARRC
jgi:hypothetical protein